MEILIYLLFWGLPALSVLWFCVSLINFLRTDKQDLELRKKRKILLIISSILMVIFVGGLIAIIIAISQAMAHM